MSMSNLVLGILVGMLIWQFVMFVLQWFQLDDGWWTVPVPYLFLLIFEGILYAIEWFKDLPLYWYLMKKGHNPFRTSITKLCAMSDDEKAEMIKLAKPKTAKALKRMYKMYS